MSCLIAGAGAATSTGAVAFVKTSFDFFDLIPNKPQTRDLVFSFLIALGDAMRVSTGLTAASCRGEGMGILGRRTVELDLEGSSTRVARAGTGDICRARLISAWPWYLYHQYVISTKLEDLLDGIITIDSLGRDSFTGCNTAQSIMTKCLGG